MLNAGVLTFQEFAMRETLPLAALHEAVLEFLQGRTDAVLFGAQAVNAYVSEPRMTQDVDLLSTDAKNLTEELRQFLRARFNIAVVSTRKADDVNQKIYQVRRKEGSRHLVTVRPVAEFPETRLIEAIQVLSPVELMASKVVSYHSRQGKAEAGTDRRDLGMLLFQFPELKEKVSAALRQKNVGEPILETWAEIASQDFQFEDEDEDFIF